MLCQFCLGRKQSSDQLLRMVLNSTSEHWNVTPPKFQPLLWAEESSLEQREAQWSPPASLPLGLTLLWLLTGSPIQAWQVNAFLVPLSLQISSHLMASLVFRQSRLLWNDKVIDGSCLWLKDLFPLRTSQQCFKDNFLNTWERGIGTGWRQRGPWGASGHSKPSLCHPGVPVPPPFMSWI